MGVIALRAVGLLTIISMFLQLLDPGNASLYVPEPLLLSYQGGRIFSGERISVNIMWYGAFSNSQRDIIHDFFASFNSVESSRPSVKSWWALTQGYTYSTTLSPVASNVELNLESRDDGYSMGRYLSEGHIEGLLTRFLTDNPSATTHDVFYLVLTAADVYVEGFCIRKCASHSSTKQFVYSDFAPGKQQNQIKLPYAWVGNSGYQCPGKCAWPFSNGEYGLESEPMKAPNEDVGVDGMIINIASMLAGTATNPFNDGYFQGESTIPLEAATACVGMYGEGAYPGHPGKLQTESITGASYNAQGVNNRKFLLPALWSPLSCTCSPPL